MTLLCAVILALARGAVGQTSDTAQLARVRQSVVQIAIMVLPLGAKVKGELSPQFKDGVLIIGSGSFVNSDGDVLTAAHVINDAGRKVKSLRAEGNSASLAIGLSNPGLNDPHMYLRKGSTYIGVNGKAFSDDIHDLALIHTGFRLAAFPVVPTSETPTLPPGVLEMPGATPVSVRISTIQPEDTTQIFVCGFPANSPTLLTTAGTIASSWQLEVPEEAAKDGSKKMIEVYEAALGMNPGDSGGPVFRANDGSLIGIIIEASGNNVANIVPGKHIAEFLNNLSVPWQSADLAASPPHMSTGKTKADSPRE